MDLYDCNCLVFPYFIVSIYCFVNVHLLFSFVFLFFVFCFCFLFFCFLFLFISCKHRCAHPYTIFIYLFMYIIYILYYLLILFIFIFLFIIVLFLPLFETQSDILIISQRGLHLTCRRKQFQKFTTDGTIGHSGGNGRYLLGNGLQSSSTVYMRFKRCCNVVLRFV